MINLYLGNDSSQSIGGGWTFLHNLEKGMTKLNHRVVDRIEDCDIFLISGVTMVKRETVDYAKELKKKIVVRIDNCPRNSRNRNTGTSRLKEFSQKADEIIWQCAWAKDYLGDFISKEGSIIYNGIDTDIFNPNGEKYDFGDRDNIYLYSRFSRDETKQWEVAWYKFQEIYKKNKQAKLMLVGQFSPEQQEYNFDFFKGEQVQYLGVIDNPLEMAKIYKACKYFLAVYFNDAFSNTYLEALACGCELYEPNMSGGTPEMLNLYNTKGIEYFNLERVVKDYVEVFNKVLSK